jgi:hypothetical protein
MSDQPITRTITKETTQILTAKWDVSNSGITYGLLKKIVNDCRFAELPEDTKIFYFDPSGWPYFGAIDVQANFHIKETKTLESEIHPN